MGRVCFWQGEQLAQEPHGRKQYRNSKVLVGQSSKSREGKANVGME